MEDITDSGKLYQTNLFTSNDLLFGLTDQQKEAVEYGKGPLLIVAGAGTGKTMVITRRIAHLINNKIAFPEEIIALTFTEKAAIEMEERVDVLLPYGLANVHISTFHSFGDMILRQYGLEIGINPDYQVLSDPEKIIFFQEHIFDFALNILRPLGNPSKFISNILKVISRAKDEDVSPESYISFSEELIEKAELQNDPELLDRARKQLEIANTYKVYQDLLAKEGKADFGDQVFLALKLLRDNPSVLSQIKDKFKYILVDEFQDTNFAQYQLVKIIGGEDANITVVGDDDQSIYKFRGAAISNILGFTKDYPNSHQIVLTRNFRSTQPILDSAYKLIQNNNPDRLEVRNRINKQLIAYSAEGPPVEHMHCDTNITEADKVSSIISQLVENGKYSYKDIAVLVRTNKLADNFIRSLNMKHVPWSFSGNRGLYERSEVRILISFLHVICNPEDSIHLYNLAVSEVYEITLMGELLKCTSIAHRENRSLYSVFEGVVSGEFENKFSPGTISSVTKIVQDIKYYQELSRDNITGYVLYQFITKSNYLKKLTQIETHENNLKVQNIARFFDVIWAFAQIAREDRVIYFTRNLDQLIDAGDDPPVAEADSDEDAVYISTIHKAKGLEWPVVFIVGLSDSKFPSRNMRGNLELPVELIREIVLEGDVHLQEERRLFYVGMTRARDILYFTSAENYGGKKKHKVSRFVREALDRPDIGEVSFKSNSVEQIERFGEFTTVTSGEMEPIADDAVLNISHYQVDDYLTCPLKYKYVHVLRLPFFHHSIVYGKAVHSAIELYYRHKIIGKPISLGELFTAFEHAWRNIGFLSREHEERRFEAGKKTIRSFFEKEELGEGSTKPFMVEEPFGFMLDKNRISGRWDFIGERDGKTVIADFKTSDVFVQGKAEKRAKESAQLIIYAMAFNARFGKMPDSLELRFVESGLTGTAIVSDKKVSKVEQNILKAANGIRKRDYTATPGYNQCSYCAYQSVCPSFSPKK